MHIKDVCETGIVFNNNAFCMDVVTYVSHMHTLTTFCGVPILYRQHTVLYLGEKRICLDVWMIRQLVTH
jgi:hypothetical protein